jgi:hypothetical protein
MRESQTAVLERGVRLDDELLTEPFEVAWAAEARWFVQVSPDGLLWVDHETGALTVPAAGLVTLPVAAFGHWLRLSVRRQGGASAALVKVVLALKE